MPDDVYLQLWDKYYQDCIPMRAHIEVTHRCNLSCCHCYIGQADAQEELSLDEIIKLLDELVELGTFYVTFSGGELFLRDDVFDILTYAGKRFYVDILTNGALITKDCAKRLRDIGIVCVDVSLYGNEEIHDAITGVSGSFHSTVRGLQFLQQEGILTTLKTTVMQTNAHQIPFVQELALNCGARFRPGLLLYPHRNGSAQPQNYGLTHDDLDRWMQVLMPQDLGDEPPPEPDPLMKSRLCTAGRNFCCVTPTGSVFPCVMLPVEVGSIRQQSFASIWRDQPKPMLQHLRSATMDDMLDCRQCSLYGHCTPCLGINYLTKSNMFRCAPEYGRLLHRFHGVSRTMEGGDPVEINLCAT